MNPDRSVSKVASPGSSECTVSSLSPVQNYSWNTTPVIPWGQMSQQNQSEHGKHKLMP